MPITFNSIQDPYGIASAGSILGQALMQRNLEELRNKRQMESEDRAEQRGIRSENRGDTRFYEREDLQNQRTLEAEQRQIEAENRKVQQKRDYELQQGTILSKALEGADLKTPEGLAAFSQKYAQMGGTIDPLELIKTMAQERIATSRPGAQTKPTIFQRKQQEAAADWVSQVRGEGLQAQQMLKELPQLKEAIYSPTLENQNFLNRWATGVANKAGFGGAIMNDPEQVIATFGKTLVTDLSNLKGLRLTDAKLRWLENAVPAVGKTPEANKRAFQIVEDLYKVRAAMPAIVEQIIEENAGEPPDNIQTLVGERVTQVLNNYIEGQPDFNDSRKKAEAQLFDQLPTASKYKGKRIVDEETGTIYESNGTNWKKVK